MAYVQIEWHGKYLFFGAPSTIPNEASQQQILPVIYMHTVMPSAAISWPFYVCVWCTDRKEKPELESVYQNK